MRKPIPTTLAALLLAAANAFAVEDADLAQYHTDDALRVPYRAIVTPGREDGESLALVVFLHGDQQSGEDNERQLADHGNGSMELLDGALRDHVPLVFVAPQTTGGYWPPRRVAAVVRDALRRFPQIDPRRVVLTGVSSGATGDWDTLKTWPACFAAAVPMSGMTELAGLAAIVDVPQWIFHGAQDDDTNVEDGYRGAMVGSRAVVRALRAMGGKPIYTEYADGRHTIWRQAYATDGLLAWMLAQRLPRAPCGFDDYLRR